MSLNQNTDSASASGAAPPAAAADGTVSAVDIVRHESRDLKQRIVQYLRKPCTYPEGYVRQDLFVGMDCPRGSEDEPVAICVACSIFCHMGHNIHELYEKRGFRCDCGNKRRGNGGRSCVLQPQKDATNEKNTYNHNFQGRYCVCDRPYSPDEDTMLQCYVCEDWFHDHCLKANGYVATRDQDVNEAALVVCRTCAPRVPLLWAYAELNRPKTSGANADDAEKVTCPLEENWRERLCDCAACREAAAASHASFIFEEGPPAEDIGDESDSPDGGDENSNGSDDEHDGDNDDNGGDNDDNGGTDGVDESVSDAYDELFARMLLQWLEKCPPHVRDRLIREFRRMVDRIMDGLRVVHAEGRAVTEEDVRNIFRELSREDGVDFDDLERSKRPRTE